MLSKRAALIRAAAHCLAAILVVGTAAAAKGTRLVHQNGWAVTAPKSWSAVQGNAALGADFRLFGPDRHGAVCAFDSRPGLELNMSNDDMREALNSGPLSTKAVSNYLLRSDLMPDELSGAVFTPPVVQRDHPSGWPFQWASFTYFDGGPKTGTPSNGLAIITFKNDTVFVGYCGADTAKAPLAADEVNAIFNSIELTR